MEWLAWLLIAWLLWHFVGQHVVKAAESEPPQKQQQHQNAPDASRSNTEPSQKTYDGDTWEGAFFDVGAQHSIKKTVRINYLDGNDSPTQRVVDIKAFEPQGASGLVIGRCRLRNATRTFRFDRMQEVVDVETGEIISNLQRCLNEEWAASPAPVLDNLYDAHHDALKLMLYMAKADGAVRAAELDVIAKHCAEITQDPRIDTAMIKDMLQYVDVVTMTTFTRVYNKLRREKPEAAKQAASACRAIVATQKTVHPSEQAALDILDKPLPQLKKDAQLQEQAA